MAARGWWGAIYSQQSPPSNQKGCYRFVARVDHIPNACFEGSWRSTRRFVRQWADDDASRKWMSLACHQHDGLSRFEHGSLHVLFKHHPTKEKSSCKCVWYGPKGKHERTPVSCWFPSNPNKSESRPKKQHAHFFPMQCCHPIASNMPGSLANLALPWLKGLKNTLLPSPTVLGHCSLINHIVRASSAASIAQQIPQGFKAMVQYCRPLCPGLNAMSQPQACCGQSHLAPFLNVATCHGPETRRRVATTPMSRGFLGPIQGKRQATGIFPCLLGAGNSGQTKTN